MKRILLSTAFLSTIPAANWAIGHVGVVCPQNGPCLVPVWPWPALFAPSGSVLMGVALVLRNVLQQQASRLWIVGCICLGAILSALVSPPSLTLASATSFFFSEMTDWAVYSPLKNRHLTVAILLAGAAGSIVDSAIFVSLAFNFDIHLIAGQIVAKMWASIFAACVIGTVASKTLSLDS